jgi:hypothetical protein
MDSDGHGHFRDVCMVYGDRYRDAFLESIREWFIRNASKSELAALRKTVAQRAARIGKRGERGRPSSKDSQSWLTDAKMAAWSHYVDGWSWRQVAESRGTRVTRANIRTIERTLVRQVDEYASTIWTACLQAGFDPSGLDDEKLLSKLEEALHVPKFREWLWVRCGIPFGRFPNHDMTAGSRKLILKLVFRGRRANAMGLVRLIRRRQQTRAARSDPSSVKK